MTRRPIIDDAPERARAIARGRVKPYLDLPHYVNSLRRLGYTDDDLRDGGTDPFIESVVAWGDAHLICDRVAAHHDAGADHVCVQVLTDDRTDIPREQWRELASILGLKNSEG